MKDIRRQTRRHYSAEEKIRIVLEGLRGEENISELCRREGIAASMYYGWSKEFLEAGKARLAKDMVDMQQINEKEGERKALEKNALADFLASQGIQAPELQTQAPQAAKDIGPSQPAGKEMGPAQQQSQPQSEKQ